MSHLQPVVWPKQDFGVLVDLDKCNGCGRCVEACKIRNGTAYEIKQKTFSPTDLTGTTWLSIRQYKGVAVPYRCFHCYSAVCALVCPVNAHIVTDYGAVVIQQDKCIGCGRCATVCCYTTPRLGLDRRYKKCDFCIDRITQGRRPACVEACPTGALRFGPIQDIYRQAREEGRRAGGGLAEVAALSTAKRTLLPLVNYIKELAARSPEDAYRLVALLDGVYKGNYLNGSP